MAIEWMDDSSPSGGIQWLDDPATQANQKQDIAWSDVPLQAIKNTPKSAVNLIEGVYETIRHPIDTATNLGKAAWGAAQNIGGGIVNKAVEQFNPDLVAFNEANRQDSESQKIANAIGGFYKDRYGSIEGIKRAISQDPVGVLADASTVLSAGGAALSKVPGLANASEAATRASVAIDPLANIVRGGGKALNLAGNGLSQVIGGLGTHTGAETIKAAYRAGTSGGDDAARFAENMRGNVPITNVLEDAKSALENMRAQRGAEYRAGMAGVSADKTILDFKPIDQAVSGVSELGSFKGKVINRSASETVQKINDLLSEWRSANPAEFHTPEGMDALKRAIGDIRDSTEFRSPSRLAADKAYSAVKKQIVQQAPEYAKTMADYEKASDLLKEVERAFSLGEKSSADTAIRKLQSITRNNANTNYGNRASLAKKLEESGAPGLTSDLSAQALNTWMPRGLGRVVAGATGVGGVMASSPYTIPLLALQSPRAMGEAALMVGRIGGIGLKGAGSINRLLELAKINPAIMANYLYQAQQPK